MGGTSMKRCIELCLLHHQWASKKGLPKCTLAASKKTDRSFTSDRNICRLSITDRPLSEYESNYPFNESLPQKPDMTVDVVCMDKWKQGSNVIEDMFASLT